MVTSGQVVHPFVPSSVTLGDAPQDSVSRAFCRALFDSLVAIGHFSAGDTNLPHAVDASDFYVNVGLTRVVQTTFFKSSIAPHLYTLVRRGYYDGLINGVVDSVNGHPWLDTLLASYSPGDEPALRKFAGYRLLAEKIQARQEFHADQRPLWANPIGDNSTFRVVLGDLDSSGSRRRMFMLADQEYLIDGAIPITYANPDRMSTWAVDTMYRHRFNDVISGTDTTRTRYIMGNSGPDYNNYTQRIQADWRLRTFQMQEAVRTSRFRFRHLNAPSVPVYYVAQVHGAFGNNEWYSGWRPTTPEEITCQGWLALSHGVEGIYYSDFLYEGEEFGVMHFNSRDTLGWADSTLPAPERSMTFRERYWEAEYDSLYYGHPNERWKGTRYPRMWLGFKSRREAVERVNTTFWNTILPIYRKLLHDPYRLSLDDTAASFSSVPLIDSAVLERAERYGTGFTGAGTYDARPAAHMDFAVFEPGRFLPTDIGAGTRYLIAVNRRCWPIDTARYSAASALRLDTIAGTLAANRHDTVGLGNIDVRRPVIRFKNSTSVLADSLVITKVTDTTWSRRIALDSLLALDWLTPGWGEMYRIIPVPSGISRHGAGYANAVRAENPSTDAGQRDRIVVYERDSLIWMRAVDSSGRWSAERMVTDEASAVPAFDKPRRYFDTHPAIATASGGGSAVIVWERYDSYDNRQTVECLRLPSRPTVALLNGSGWRSGAYDNRLSRQYTPLSGSLELTPAIVAIDSGNEGHRGYVVAWASQDSGIDLCALRDVSAELSPAAGRDTLHFGPLYATQSEYGHPITPFCLFPTLAYVPNRGGLPVPKTPPGIVSRDTGVTILANEFNVLHLAYQQETPDQGWRIMYNPAGVEFIPDGSIRMAAAVTEHVSQSLAGCSFIHPSIATDSVRLGVAFEIANTRHSVGLRFRDTLVTGDTLRNVKAWRTPLYAWGGLISSKSPRVTLGRNYEWPSLTQFPSFPMDSSRQVLDGAITWQWTNPPDSRELPLMLYRYGNAVADTLSWTGRYPTMVRVPYRRTAPFSASGIFHRGAEPDSFPGTAYLLYGTRYHPAALINTPTSPSLLFSANQGSRAIFAHFRVKPSSLLGPWSMLNCTSNQSRELLAGIHIKGGGISIPSDSLPWLPIDPLPKTVPTLPPSFFNPPYDGAIRIESLTSASGVARTGDFIAGMGDVAILRTVAGSDSLIAWLDAQPYDSAAGSPGDIRILTELVRSSDGFVLWRGDSVSARTVGGGYQELAISVPVDTAAPGTLVHVRLRAVPTAGFESTDVSAGFHFEDSTVNGYLKMRRLIETPGMSDSNYSLDVAVHPNPVVSTAEILVRIPAAGLLEVAVYNVVGDLIERFPSTFVDTSGEFGLSIATGRWPAGTYTVRVRIGTHQRASQFVVKR